MSSLSLGSLHIPCRLVEKCVGFAWLALHFCSSVIFLYISLLLSPKFCHKILVLFVYYQYAFFPKAFFKRVVSFVVNYVGFYTFIHFLSFSYTFLLLSPKFCHRNLFLFVYCFPLSICLPFFQRLSRVVFLFTC